MLDSWIATQRTIRSVNRRQALGPAVAAATHNACIDDVLAMLDAMREQIAAQKVVMGFDRFTILPATCRVIDWTVAELIHDAEQLAAEPK